MRWWRVLLIVVASIGALIVGIGLLAVIASLTDPDMSSSDRSDTILGGLFIALAGLSLFVPCLAVFLVTRPRNPLPYWPSGPLSSPATAPLAVPSGDLRRSYVEWFGWCQREIGGDAIALHAATMAALSQASAGRDVLAAARRAGQLVSPGAGAFGQPSPRVPGSKLRTLAMTGAALLPLLEEGESVLVSFQGIDMSANMWRLLFGWIGYLIAASQTGSYYVTVTDRRVIVLAGPQLGMPPRELAFALPRAMVSWAKYSRFLLTGSFTITRITGESIRMTLDRRWFKEGALAQSLLATGFTPTPMPPAPSLR
jgi:hypothetical protein